MAIEIIASAVTIAQSAPAWVPIVLSTASTVTTGFLNRLVGNEYNRETQLLIENKRQQAQLAQMKFQCLQHESTQSLQRELQASNHEFQLTQQQIKIASDQELQANNHQFQFLQQKDSQKFQVAYSKLNADYQRELQEFIQECNSRSQRDSQAFLAWKWEQEKSLQVSLTEYGRETQLIMAAFNRETTMQSIEEHHILQNWPLNLMPSQIVKHSDRMPLRVILAPPDVDYDKFVNQNIEGNKRKIPNLEKGLSAGLREFVSSNYSPFHQPQRVVQLLDGAWESKKHRDGASISALHSKLSSESILILQSSIDGDRLNFDYYFWSNGCEPIHQSLLANYNFVDILYDSAKKRARKWKLERDQLLALDHDPIEFNQIDTRNLALLEQEDGLKQEGIDISKFQPRYIPIDKDFDNLREWLLTHHRLILALCTDVYYLVQANTTPLLPQLLPELFPLGIDPKTMDFVLTSYENTIDSLVVERSTLIPDLYLDLAQTFQTFSDRTYIRRCLFKSLQALFHLRHNSSGLLAQDLDACLLVPKKYLTTSDRDYVQKLNACLERFGINFVDICLQCGIDLIRQKDYYSAIAEFNLLISLDAKIPIAYFNRGLVHFELKQYSDAIADLTQVINSAAPDEIIDGFSLLGSAYEQRGLAYLKLRDYHTAIPDFDRALDLGLTTAAKEREVAFRVLEELRIQEKAAEQERQRRTQRKHEEDHQRWQDALFRLQNLKFKKGKCTVLVLGDFNRGKSTFLNVLLGQKVLPTRATRCTAISTVVRFGQHKRDGVKVYYNNGHETVPMTEKEFHEKGFKSDSTREQTGIIVLECPSPILTNGIEFIDTPSLNHSEEQNRIAYNYIRHCDAIIFLLSAEQQLTTVEQKYLEELLLFQSNINNVFFLINKWDLIPKSDDDDDYDPEEEIRDTFITRLSKCLIMAEKEVEKLRGKRIFEISAKFASDKLNKNETLDGTGFPEFIDSFADFLENKI